MVYFVFKILNMGRGDHRSIEIHTLTLITASYASISDVPMEYCIHTAMDTPTPWGYHVTWHSAFCQPGPMNGI